LISTPACQPGNGFNMDEKPPTPRRKQRVIVAVFALPVALVRLAITARRLVGLILLAIFIGAPLFHWRWGVNNKRYLTQRIGELQKAGEPILPADFLVANPDGIENGGPDILAAGQMVKNDMKMNNAFDALEPALPLRMNEREVIQAAAERNSESLGLLERAVLKPRSEWIIDKPVLVKFASLEEGGLYSIRPLANMLAYLALLDHERGDDRSAVERIDRILFVGRFADRHPTMIGHLVAVGILTMTADRTAEIAIDLRIGDGPIDATPAKVRVLIDALLDDTMQVHGAIRAIQAERMMMIDTMQSMADGVPIPTGDGKSPIAWKGPARYLIKPVLYRTARLMLEYTTKATVAVGQQNWPTAKSKMPPQPSNSALNMFASIWLSSFDRTTETHFRRLTDHRLAATALAVRWYAVEHDGQLPQRLEDLVPRYLPSVPADPMAAGGQPLRYLPRPGSPIVYSVGVDGIDDGGSEARAAAFSRLRSRQPPADWQMKDRVLHLTRQPRPAAQDTDAPDEPATQPTSISSRPG
jgi:hypothetical protein